MPAAFVASEPEPISAALTEPMRYKSDRQTYHPARLEWGETGWRVTPLPWFGSPVSLLALVFEPVTLFAGPAINGNAVAGISGWIAQSSEREVGLSVDLRF